MTNSNRNIIPNKNTETPSILQGNNLVHVNYFDNLSIAIVSAVNLSSMTQL